MASTAQPPLIAIVGPTASGKTELAINLALRWGGEIICADSRTVYKGMDIGTAKPSLEEQAKVPHHLLDVVDPDDNFSVADFQRLAKQAIESIRSRHRTPFLVGGTGLYVDSILFDYKFGPKADQAQRSKFESMSVEQLQEYCKNNNIELPENSKNKRYLIRNIERGGVVSSDKYIIKDCFVVGISTDKAILKARIEKRADSLFASGMLEEAIEIAEQYNWKGEAFTGNIYRLAQTVQRGEMSFAEARDKFITLDWRLAKRQLTWLRRHSFIHWGEQKDIPKMVEVYLKSRET
jgi:tRNA dimethylallyltransferase